MLAAGFAASFEDDVFNRPFGERIVYGANEARAQAVDPAASGADDMGMTFPVTDSLWPVVSILKAPDAVSHVDSIDEARLDEVVQSAKNGGGIEPVGCQQV